MKWSEMHRDRNPPGLAFDRLFLTASLLRNNSNIYIVNNEFRSADKLVHEGHRFGSQAEITRRGDGSVLLFWQVLMG